MRWYLIQTKPAGELVARANLEQQGFRVYYPRLARRAHLRGRWTERIGALFPRYLFLQLNVGLQALAPARSTVGVANIVRFGHDYALVPDPVIECLRMRADPDTGLHRLADQEGQLAPNSPVRITAGLFAGLEGVFLRKSGEARVLVLLSILGQSTPVRIPAALVVPQPGTHAPAAWSPRPNHAYR